MASPQPAAMPWTSLPLACPLRPGCLPPARGWACRLTTSAGFWAYRHVTAHGHEHTLALNYLAPFLLTSLLLARLTASAPARFVAVSSGVRARGGSTLMNCGAGAPTPGSVPARGRSRPTSLRALLLGARPAVGALTQPRVPRPGMHTWAGGDSQQDASVAGQQRPIPLDARETILEIHC